MQLLDTRALLDRNVGQWYKTGKNLSALQKVFHGFPGLFRAVCTAGADPGGAGDGVQRFTITVTDMLGTTVDSSASYTDLAGNAIVNKTFTGTVFVLDATAAAKAAGAVYGATKDCTLAAQGASGSAIDDTGAAGSPACLRFRTANTGLFTGQLTVDAQHASREIIICAFLDNGIPLLDLAGAVALTDLD
mgnify:CR=1 FL=1